jgi:hypothetical protein
MEEGQKVTGNKKDGLSAEKGGRIIKFDIKVETPKGVLWCAYIRRSESEEGEVAAEMSNAVPITDDVTNEDLSVTEVIKIVFPNDMGREGTKTVPKTNSPSKEGWVTVTTKNRRQSIPPGRYNPATGKTVSWNVTASEVDVATETEAQVAKDTLMNQSECEDCGPMDEYVGCKIEKLETGGVKFRQKVLLQSYRDEFDILKMKKVNTPAASGTVLIKPDEETDTILFWCGEGNAHDAVFTARYI